MVEELVYNLQAYQNLGNAIIKQAYDDYIALAFATPGVIITKNGRIIKEIHENNSVLTSSVNKDEIEKFFHSSLYSSITSIDPDVLLEKADAEIKLIMIAIQQGLIWDQFTMINQGSLISIDKYDYNRFVKDTRRRRALLNLVDRFEQKVTENQDFHDSSFQVYKVQNVKYNQNVEPCASDKIIYIAPNHGMHFYAFDSKSHRYYKIFDKRCIKKKREYLKK